MGPLCTIGQLENIEKEVSQAIEEGGQILHGGKRPENVEGLFYEPTIISPLVKT
jgi:aldehyde dehydrogenase (NAD+)